jgi:hypothetical protein
MPSEIEKMAVAAGWYPITERDRIFVRGATGTSGSRHRLRTRIMLEDGRIIMSDLFLSSDNTRAFITASERAPRGWIISMTHTFITMAINRGEEFVQAGVFTGGTTFWDHVTALLISNYGEWDNALVWPGSPIVSQDDRPGFMVNETIANPAAGANFTHSVPNGSEQKLHACSFLFTTDATVATRLVTMSLQDSVNNILVFSAPVAPQTASLAISYSFARGFQATQPAANAVQSLPLWDIRGDAGQQFASNIITIQAGDQISNIECILEETIHIA